MLPIISFSFARYRAPRVLPSFPTRRSSDLRIQSFAGDDPRVLPQLPGELSMTDIDGIDPPGAPGQQHLDRKSTRLNSSHVSISYAVFCLKKKNRSQVFQRAAVASPSLAVRS